MSKISDLYGFGDIKYYRELHKQRQIQQGNPYVCYEQFRRRLKNWRLLKEAIYTPQTSVKLKKTPLPDRDGIRKATLIANDIRFKGEWLDTVFRKAEEAELKRESLKLKRDPIQLTEEEIEMFNKEFPDKPTLRNRFLNLFKPKH